MFASSKAEMEAADLPVGGHVKRENGLVWRRRVDWLPADYKFIAENYRKLARGYEDIAAAVDEERERRFGKGADARA